MLSEKSENDGKTLENHQNANGIRRWVIEYLSRIITCFFPIWTWMALIYYDFPIEHCHFTGVSWWYQTLLIRRGPFGKGFETWGSCRLRDSNDTQFSVGLEMVRGFFFCKLHGNLKFIFYHMGRFFAGQSSLGTSFYMEMWMMFSMSFQCIRGRWTNYYMYIYIWKKS